VSMDVCDGDLVRLARDGDPVAFRLLVERHQPMARARASRLCPNPSDVDDIVQESFLQAFVGLDRLRDPDRFAGWLAGIVLNVCRAQYRRAPLTLLPDWPEPLHPAAADGLPSADDLDRADVLREALADLPAGQRRAVALHYYADLPAGQIAEPAGAARASLHKARLRLRAYITSHRPDLVPAVARRTHMTTVRIARAEPRVQPDQSGQSRPVRSPTHVVVLADDAGHRELPIWLLGFDGVRLSQLLGRPAGAPDPAGDPDRAGDAEARTADALTAQLLRAAGASVTGVDIDELGPEVTAARIGLAGRAGTQHVTARLAEALALAITAGAPVRVADTVLDRLAVPIQGDDRPGPSPAPAGTPGPSRPHIRPRYEPLNLTFADGLEGWLFAGSFTEHASESHWQDYSCSTEPGSAVISSAVPQPPGFALLGQEVFADDYRGATVVLRGEFRTGGGSGRAGLFLRVNEGRSIRGPVTDDAVFGDPDNNIVTIAGDREWTSHAVEARVPEDTDAVVFGIFLAGQGRIELRNAELIRVT
jgi:RNA polymerase sigma factor (sigma-70 family)